MNPTASARGSSVEIDATLDVVAGAIPADLTGHVFVVGPAGLPGPPGRSDGESLLQGDGMILRIDWSRGMAAVKTRIVRTPCHLADVATAGGAGPPGAAFRSAGILRVSPRLGARNFANTALVPFDFGDGARLLATYDGGRPIEIDPTSLRVITAVGASDEWRSTVLADRPFPAVLSTAHPAVDAAAKRMYMVCFGHSRETLTASVRGVGALRPLIGLGALDPLLVAALGGSMREAFVELVEWDGVGRLARFPLVDATGAPVTLRQSAHQIAVTRRYVVVMDTSVKVTPTQALSVRGGLGRALRDRLASPPLPSTAVWIVRRADLVAGSSTVRAVRAKLPVESVHFVADFDDERGLRLHVGHNAAMDFGEWIRDYDVNHFTGAAMPAEMVGVPCVTPMDVSRVATWRIDPTSGEVLASSSVHDDRRTWGVALYATPGVGTLDQPAERHAHVTWSTTGFVPALLTRFLHDQYAEYPRRITPLDAIARMRSGGRPACLVRVDVDSLALDGCYEFDGPAAVGAVQHVPGAGAGYLVATVATEHAREVWVFDAGDLERGPVCRLAHPALCFGMTLHAAWLPTLSPRRSPYAVSVRRDCGPALRGSASLERLFECLVYPPFDCTPRVGQ